jgi:hypothetical protein
MRLGQTRQDGILGPADRAGALDLVTGLRDVEHDKHTGAADAGERADLGLDQGISPSHAGTESRTAHNFRDEKHECPDTHETHYSSRQRPQAHLFDPLAPLEIGFIKGAKMQFHPGPIVPCPRGTRQDYRASRSM